MTCRQGRLTTLQHNLVALASQWAFLALVLPSIVDAQLRWLANPVAGHVACFASEETPALCTLYAAEERQLPLDYLVTSLPEVGELHDILSGSDSSSVANMTLQQITPAMLPFSVVNPERKVVYTPPTNSWAPARYWTTFRYMVETVNQAVTRSSTEAVVVMVNPQGMVATASFDDPSNALEGWSISGNGQSDDPASQGLQHKAIFWGELQQFVVGADMEVPPRDQEGGTEHSRWFFEASPAEFHKEELVTAFGGTLEFWLRALYGNFTRRSSMLDLVRFECEVCNQGGPMKLVHSGESILADWDGSEVHVLLNLTTAGWYIENGEEPTTPNECDFVRVLSNISRFAVLGDFTHGPEAVAIDTVTISAAPTHNQPMIPLVCLGATLEYI